MIVGINGVLVAPSGRRVGMAGSGKDTVADVLVKERGFVKVSLADPLKRICRDVFDFSVEQLWGPSERRSEPDLRYIRRRALKGLSCEDEPEYLTPRLALQLLGTEWGRECYPDVWIDYAMRAAKKLSEEGGYNYYATSGPQHDWRRGEENWKWHVAIPDVRFKNEIAGIKAGGGKVVRVVRPLKEEPQRVDLHPSEQEALSIPDKEFDYILDNSGDLHTLGLRAGQMYDVLSGKIRAYDSAQEDVPPYKRS